MRNETIRASKSNIWLSVRIDCPRGRPRSKGKVRRKMKAVITVIGKDSVGIIATVSAECAKYSVNIVDITQSVIQDYFAMIMLVEIDNMSSTFMSFQKELEAVGVEKNLDIRVMHEDIFNTMHRI
jgi:ACT domain-containing protein